MAGTTHFIFEVLELKFTFIDIKKYFWLIKICMN